MCPSRSSLCCRAERPLTALFQQPTLQPPSSEVEAPYPQAINKLHACGGNHRYPRSRRIVMICPHAPLKAQKEA